MPRLSLPALFAALAVCLPAADAYAAQAAQPDPRKFPLARCDKLDGEARMSCLEKARVEILEARRQREAGFEAPAEKPKPDRKP